MITKKSIEAVIEAAHIEEVVKQYVSLKRRGVNMIGLCPFHQEKTPSFSVSPTKGIFKCFGCGKGGDAVEFVKEREGTDFLGAIRMLAKMLNVPIEERERTAAEENDYQRLQAIYLLNEKAKSYYQQQLPEAKDYLQQRGITDSIANLFAIGVAGTKSKLVAAAQKQQFKMEQIEAAGLARDKEDFFSNRLIIPLHNHLGKCVGFTGRVLDDTRLPKYMNTRETEVYEKSKILYGFHLAKEHIRRSDECVVVEGQFDVISLFQSGVKNVVAMSGTALSEYQVRLIKRFTKRVTLMLDGDAAGQKAILRSLEVLLSEGMEVRIVALEKGTDPDDIARSKGTEGVKELLNTATDFVLYLARQRKAELKSNPAAKGKLLSELTAMVAYLPEASARKVYLDAIAKLLDQDFQEDLPKVVVKAKKLNENWQELEHFAILVRLSGEVMEDEEEDLTYAENSLYVVEKIDLNNGVCRVIKEEGTKALLAKQDFPDLGKYRGEQVRFFYEEAMQMDIAAAKAKYWTSLKMLQIHLAAQELNLVMRCIKSPHRKVSDFENYQTLLANRLALVEGV